MWLSDLRRKLTGSTLSLKEREVLALEEHNALLRAQLELGGVKNLPRRVLDPHPRQRTEADITRVTRESIWKRQQDQKADALRPWNVPDPPSVPPQASDAADPEKATTPSIRDTTSASDPSETF